MLPSNATYATNSTKITERRNRPQARSAAARAGWVQRSETFTRHSCERPMLTSTRLLFDTEHIQTNVQQPTRKDGSTPTTTTSTECQVIHRTIDSGHNLLHVRPHLIHQQSSNSSSSSSPADLQSLAEKGKVHRNTKMSKQISRTEIVPLNQASLCPSNLLQSAPSITVLNSEPDDWFVDEVEPSIEPFERSRTAIPLASLTRFDPPIRPNSQLNRLARPTACQSGQSSSASNRSLSSASSGASSVSSSSCCDCGDSDEQLQRPIIRSRSDRFAFRPQLIAATHSPPTSNESPRSLSVDSSDNEELARPMLSSSQTEQLPASPSSLPQQQPRPCRSLLCLLDSPCARSLSSGMNRRAQLRRSTATAGSIDSSSSWSSDAFFQPQVGLSSSERLSSRSSLDKSESNTNLREIKLKPIEIDTETKTNSNAVIASTTSSGAPKRVLGRRQTIAAKKLNAFSKQLSTSSATRLLTETSVDPSIDSETDLCYQQLGSSIERSFDLNDPPIVKSSINCTTNRLRSNMGVERSHTVGANLRSMARSIGRFVGADNSFVATASTGSSLVQPDLNRSLDRSSTFDSLRSLESRALANEPRSKTSIGNDSAGPTNTSAGLTPITGGLHRIRSLNPIRVLRPMRGLNPLRSFGIARMRSLSAAELREEREDSITTDRSIGRLSRTPQPPQTHKEEAAHPHLNADLLSPANLLPIHCQSYSHPSLDSVRPDTRAILDISFAFDQTARKLLICLRHGQLFVSNAALLEPIRLQVKLSLLPGRREKCKSKLCPVGSDGQVVFDQQFSWTRIRPEQMSSLALHCVLGTVSNDGKRRVVGEQLLPFSVCRPQLQQRRVQLHLDPPTVNMCRFESDASNGTGPASSTKSMHEMALDGPRRRSQPIVGSSSRSSKASRSSATGTAALAGMTTAAIPGGLFQWNGSASALSSLDATARPELLLGLAYNATTGRLQVSVVRGSQLHVRCAQKPPHSFVKCALLSCTGQELARGKTSVRRAQPNPLFKQTFAFQVSHDEVTFRKGVVRMSTSVVS